MMTTTTLLGVQDEQLTASYRDETAKKLRQVEELSDPDHPRLFNATQCSQCGGPLDLPSVHFMCNHSFHQRSVVHSVPTFRLLIGAVDAWGITIQSARSAYARTGSYKKSGGTTSGSPTNTTFSWQKSRRMGSVLSRRRSVEVC
jgi:hypothetical protein